MNAHSQKHGEEWGRYEMGAFELRPTALPPRVGRAEGGPGGGGRGADEVAQGAADGQVPQGALLAIQGRQAAPDEVLGSPTAPTSPLCRLDCRRVSAVAACSEVVCLCFARPIHPLEVVDR